LGIRYRVAGHMHRYLFSGVFARETWGGWLRIDWVGKVGVEVEGEGSG
jgi:hypothetical protein